MDLNNEKKSNHDESLIPLKNEEGVMGNANSISRPIFN